MLGTTDGALNPLIRPSLDYVDARGVLWLRLWRAGCALTGPLWGGEDAEELLARTVAGRGAISLCITGVGFADEFTKTVFVQF